MLTYETTVNFPSTRQVRNCIVHRRHGQYHRLDGPAILWEGGKVLFCIRGTVSLRGIEQC